MKNVKVFTKEINKRKANMYVQYNSCRTDNGRSTAYLVYIRLMNMKSISHRSLCSCAFHFQFGINLLI